MDIFWMNLESKTDCRSGNVVVFSTQDHVAELFLCFGCYRRASCELFSNVCTDKAR